jgi:hypothetical protein
MRTGQVAIKADERRRMSKCTQVRLRKSCVELTAKTLGGGSGADFGGVPLGTLGGLRLSNSVESVT